MIRGKKIFFLLLLSLCSNHPFINAKEKKNNEDKEKKEKPKSPIEILKAQLGQKRFNKLLNESFKVGIGTITIDTSASNAVYNPSKESKFKDILFNPGKNILNESSPAFSWGGTNKLPRNQSLLVDNLRFGKLVNKKVSNGTYSGDFSLIPQESKYAPVEITITNPAKLLSKDPLMIQPVTSYYKLKGDLPFTLYMNHTQLVDRMEKYLKKTKHIQKSLKRGKSSQRAPIDKINGYLMNITFNPYGGTVYTDPKGIFYSIAIDSIDFLVEGLNPYKRPGGVNKPIHGVINIDIKEIQKLNKDENILRGWYVDPDQGQEGTTGS